MAAYVISEVKLLDKEAAANYMRHAAASIEKYDGHYLARGVDPVVVEGESTDRKIVIVEFPSLERAKEWYASPAYAEALQFRDKALERKLTFVDGVAQFAAQ